jgi:glycerol-3-phosphate acyltransferase PlsX
LRACLAVDVMGGDNAPEVIINGLFIFHQRCPQCSFILCGNEQVLTPLLTAFPSLKEVCEIVHTDESIKAETKPSHALRGMVRSSMRLALEAVASKRAHGAISAGNTGAYMALSKMILKTLGGIDRPAIASQIPTAKGESVMLDLGGTLEASSRNLVEYALMGEVFAKKVLGIARPTVGLLNVGKEETKGNDTLQQAFLTLKSSSLNFHGFIEGDDISLGTVSVVVTDGFTGNVALKTGEGVTKFCFSSFKNCLSSSLRGKLAGWLAAPFFKELKNHFDPRSYNGALWLGLNGVAVKSHGGTDALGFAHAVEMAYDMVIHNVTDSIHQAFINDPFSGLCHKVDSQDF